MHPLKSAWNAAVKERTGPGHERFRQGPSNHADYRYGTPVGDDGPQTQRWRAIIRDNIDQFSGTWDLLADFESRFVLLECLVFNAFGWQWVRRTRNTPAYQDFIKALASEAGHPDFPVLERDVRPIRHKMLHQHHLLKEGLRLVTSDGFFINVMQNRQYFLRRGGIDISPQSGDVIIDGGAGWGDTTLLFARRAGPDGAVIAFEFSPSNLSAFRQHLDMNPELADRVSLEESAMGQHPGRTVHFDDRATSAHVAAQGSETVKTDTIDNVVAARGLSTVDFIKMDIEGAEEAALMGAVKTLRRFGPRLAIAAYHRPSDLLRIPRVIRAIRPDYELYLDHHTIHAEETILYARVRPA